MALSEGTATIKIFGSGAGAVAAIKAANENGQDFFTIPWSGFDSVIRSTVLLPLAILFLSAYLAVDYAGD